MKSNICYFCKREFDEHSQNDIDDCVEKFKGEKGQVKMITKLTHKNGHTTHIC